MESLRALFRRLIPHIKGLPLVITYGNGPMVGEILLRSELAKHRVPPLPLYMCVAHSQAEVGLLIGQTLTSELSRHNIDATVATVVTQVVVDREDPSFSNPQKPVGLFYSRKEAEHLSAELGWQMIRDGNRGYRRVVPSPMPLRVVEIDAIRGLFEGGIIPLCGGGGGVAVYESEQGLKPIDCVVDKDYTTELIATAIGAERIINITQVDGVYLNYGSKEQQRLHMLTIEMAKEYLQKGEFQPGSMAPKISSAIAFIERGGKEVLITNTSGLEPALHGHGGTRIVA